MHHGFRGSSPATIRRRIAVLESLLVGSIPGIILGSYAARYAPEWVLKPSLAVILTIVGLKMLTA
jgi:uncharacterized membrane protein YfcA